VATYLVQHGADPNDVSIDEKKKAHNLLMDAIVVSNTELASLLVEKGANIEYADEDGVTVLTQAAYLGEVPIVKALLAAGADVTAANNEGITPLVVELRVGGGATAGARGRGRHRQRQGRHQHSRGCSWPGSQGAFTVLIFKSLTLSACMFEVVVEVLIKKSTENQAGAAGLPHHSHCGCRHWRHTSPHLSMGWWAIVSFDVKLY
jgi:hypothetical protein